MKAKIQMFNQNDPIKCLKQLNGYSLSRRLLLLRSFIQSTQFLILQSAHQAILNGLSALVKVDKRKVVGCVLLMVGVFGIFSHQLLFNEAARDYTWYYRNWYYFVFTLRPWMVLIIWSAAFILFIPKKYTLAFIPFSLFNSIGWSGFLHYAFFVDSNISFHTFPAWSVIAAGFVLGFSIVMSANYLIHTYNHRVMAFEKRLLTLYNGADLVDDQTFKGLFKKYVEEKQAFQKTI